MSKIYISYICFTALVLLALFSLHIPGLGPPFVLQAQQGLIKRSELLGITVRPENISIHRKCTNMRALEQGPTSPIDIASGEEMKMRWIVKSEITKIKKLLGDIRQTHRDFAKLYPQTKTYHELEIEDLPTKRDIRGNLTSLRSVIAFHYSADGKLDCIVLDSFRRNIYQENQWTQKLMRFRFSDIASVELQARRYNYDRITNLENYSAEVRYQAYRSIFSSLLKALYKMDLILASRNYYWTKTNQWQAEF